MIFFTERLSSNACQLSFQSSILTNVNVIVSIMFSHVQLGTIIRINIHETSRDHQRHSKFIVLQSWLMAMQISGALVFHRA